MEPKTLRIDCAADLLSENKMYSAWLDRFKAFVNERTDQTARLRMYAYELGGASWVALDIFCDDSTKDMTITVCVTPGRARVFEPIESQMDIELPGIVEVIDFAALLTAGNGSRSGHIQLSAWADRN